MDDEGSGHLFRGSVSHSGGLLMRLIALDLGFFFPEPALLGQTRVTDFGHGLWSRTFALGFNLWMRLAPGKEKREKGKGETCRKRADIVG